MNFDEPRNQAFLATHVQAFPALLVIDPDSEQVTSAWSGTATPVQLAGFLDAARAPRPAGDALRRGDMLLGKGDAAGAVRAYDEAIAAGGAGREHALEQLATALQLGDAKPCAERLAAEAPRMTHAHAFVIVVLTGAACAGGDPSVATSASGQQLAALATEALDLPDASEDDHYQLYEALYALRGAVNDAAGAHAIAEQYAAYVDSRPPPSSDDERMARDLARLRATLKLGTPEHAIASLEASERVLATDASAAMRLATAYLAAGRTDDAIAAATRGLARHPMPTEAARLYGLRAKAAAKRGDTEAARRDLQAGLAAVATIPVAAARDMTRGQLQHQLDGLH